MRFIDLQQLNTKLAEKEKTFFLIDVREPEEFEDGHLLGAMLIPWHMVDEKIGGIKKEKELVLYCQTNNRATRAAGTLEDLGYQNISVYKGGWEEWSRTHH
jgi:rhodanese-related sulfurtransferase